MKTHEKGNDDIKLCTADFQRRALSSRTKSPLILHIPHASAEIPDSYRSSYRLSDADLEQELTKLTDWFTDELFNDPKVPRTEIVFPYSRLFVDVERFADDAHEPMASRGMGVFYTKTTDGRPLRPEPDERTATELKRLYAKHQSIIRHAVETAIARDGRAVIIDCHSFPEQALPCHNYGSTSNIAFCIGTDPEHTPKWLSECLLEALSSNLGKVVFNTPFAGSFVPSSHYRKDFRVLSVMIEVNRGLYMDEVTGTKAPRYAEVQQHLRKALSKIDRQLAEN